MNNWKKQLSGGFLPEGDSAKILTDFIETEIIEKLIEEIPNEVDEKELHYWASLVPIKKQLRASWLGAVCTKCGDSVKGDTDGLCGRCV